jgi:hypothetical protein
MSGKVTCPQAVSRESHRTRNKNKQTGLTWTNLNINLNSILITIWSSSSSVHRALCKLVASCHKYNTSSELASERRTFL